MTSPFGESRGGTPAGERARKRRAAQAALSVARPARRLRAGHQTLRLPAFRFLFLSFVIAGHSRSKNGVASLAYDPAIHAAAKLVQIFRC